MSLSDVRKLVEERHLGEDLLDAVDMVLGLGFAAAGGVAGATAGMENGLLYWHAIEPKSAVIDVLRAGVRKLCEPRPDDLAYEYVERAQRLAAANCLLVYAAYYDALRCLWPEAAAQAGLSAPDADVSLADLIAAGREEAAREVRTAREELPLLRLEGAGISGGPARSLVYVFLGSQFCGLVERWLGSQPRGAGEENIPDVYSFFRNELPVLAESFYQAAYLGLLADSGQFFQYDYLQQRMAEAGHFRRAEDFQSEAIGRLREIREEHAAQFAKVSLAARKREGQLDVGLRDLRAAIESLAEAVSAGGAAPDMQDPDIQDIARRLHDFYRRGLDEPVIEDQFEPDASEAQLGFPAKLDAFMPQAYRLVHCDGTDLHLEREDAWRELPVKDDVGACVLRHLESPYSVEAPLLILGQPGSGKSLLSEVLAGHLAYPAYTAVRVRLRHYDPGTGHSDPGTQLLSQLEKQIHQDISKRVDWADFARGVGHTPPVVILDGYDELLQATGTTYAGFLNEVQRFQRNQAWLGQPLRVIATSRVSLIDKVDVPPGTTVLRLEEFDPARQRLWTTAWNAQNSGYFSRTGVRPFQLPENERLAELARQPLLLLMLAIYDSASNELSDQTDIDQTQLYDRLLRRFIDRELAKRPDGPEYRAQRRTSDAAIAKDAEKKIEAEMARLGVAAIGMFNRQDTKILSGDLDQDLHYFDAARPGLPGTGAVGQAALLLGSFFFVQQSQGAGAPGAAADSGPVAFEFLHNTFGEFLAADFILRHLMRELRTLRSMARDPEMSEELRVRLTQPHPGWLDCLLHTPLFTRPVILRMAGEWSRHLLGDGEEREELLAAFDRLVTVHLRIALHDLALPASASGAPRLSPYSALPVRGRVATYTVNLLLLRAYVGGEEYLLDEGGLAAGEAACGPWDGLTHLWRSWFTPESLSGLAEVFTAHRQAGGISIVPWGYFSRWGGNSVMRSRSVSVSLADDVLAALSGLSLAASAPFGMPLAEFENLLADINARVPELSETASNLSKAAYSPDGSGWLQDSDDSPFPDPFDKPLTSKLLERVELAARLTRTPRQWLDGLDHDDVVLERDFLLGTRYQVEALVDAGSALEPGFVAALVSGLAGEAGPGVVTWAEALASHGLAPALRWAVRELGHDRCARIASQARAALPRDPFPVADIDTASALAVLADIGASEDLRNQLLAMIIDRCRSGEGEGEGEGEWSLLDIPVETWERLADMFVAGSPGVTARRAEFVGLLDTAVRKTMKLPEGAGLEPLGEEFTRTAGEVLAFFRVQALRIGANMSWVYTLDPVLGPMRDERSGKDVGWSRKCMLALAGLARERDDHKLAMDVFFIGELRGALVRLAGLPNEAATLDGLDEAVAGRQLTYKEAMDVRWVLATVPARMSAAEIREFRGAEPGPQSS